MINQFENHISLFKKNKEKNKKMLNKFHSSINLLFMIAIAALFFTGCLSAPNYDAAKAAETQDISDYCDYKVTRCKLPDGRKVDMYVFNEELDLMFWQNAQYRHSSTKWKKNIASGSVAESWTAKGAKGPETPFWEAYDSIIVKYGGDKIGEVMSSNKILSYYDRNDLGELSDYLVTPNSSAQGCYEDSEAVYLITVCHPKNLKSIKNDRNVQNLHKEHYVYSIESLPKKMYEKKRLPNIKPAKITPFNPDSIPDSNRNLTPESPSGNGAYYYDVNLAYQLQWLAVNIACRGVYDMAYTGDFRAKNPTDHYQTRHIKSYLAKDDGRTTKGTILFEGVCFDYADFAYQEMKNNIRNYSNVAGYWMVGTFDNPNDILAYRIAKSGELSDRTINQTPVIENCHNRIHAHDGATCHAWLWVQSTDGTMYWVDPTWTDNTGRPVYGIVRGGQEIRLEPDSRLCVQ
ncbi:MAG: hypothetical protein K6B43_10760 [Treponema sp.]|nr:hypothetical protein [Treponema sp.]